MVFRGMLQGHAEMQTMRKEISQSQARCENGKILLSSLFGEMAGSQQASCDLSDQGLQDLRKKDEVSPQKQGVLLHSVPGSHGARSLRTVQGVVSTVAPEACPAFLQSVLRREMEHELSESQAPQTHPAHACRNGSLESVPGRCAVELLSEIEKAEIRWSSQLVQDRHSFSRDQTGNRIGREIPRTSQRCGARSEARCGIEGTWVDSVTILEPGSVSGYSKDKGGYPVHNLEVSGHPSYSVNNVIVHNCYVGGKWVGLGTLAGIKQDYIFFLADELQFMAETFISSWPNMFSNGHVKIIGSGNPKHDPDDQLGITAEPKDGWQSMPEPDKTETWDTQFMGGRAVNLVGTDSPNFETPEGQPEPYPKLIGRRFAKRIINDYGENSPEFYTQIKGVMKIDMADQRVITRQLCRQHFATTKAVWAGSPRTKIYALDPSYGGGDLCWKIILEFGIDVNGEELIEVVLSDQIKIDMRKDVSAEDQVTEQVDLDLKKHGIPVENAFYDPYGKGTMGFHFSKRFGSNCPIPVDSGGPPTERPVRQNLFVHGVDGKRRLKTCREHYSKFVTEAWFSVSYTIQADQLRMLPNDAMLEGCARKYYMVGGNKIEVESKDDFKTRVGHSPNKFDALAIGVEGARQRGFHIAKLGLEVDKKTGNDEWFEKEVAEFEEMIAAGLLNHSDRKVTMHL
jgi:hypothetical protein